MSMCSRCGAISDDPENHWCADYQHAIDKATRTLRAEHRDEVARLTAERDALEAENERLRAALGRIAAYKHFSARLFLEVQAIARAALEGKP